MSGDLALIADLEAGGALTPVGLTLPPTITIERFEAVGRMLGAASESVKFAAGDWLKLAEEIFPEEASQIVEALDWSPAVKQQAVRVAERVPLEIRNPGLSWSHHRQVAAIQTDGSDYENVALRRKWLSEALERNLTRRELEDELRAAGLVRQRERANQRPYVIEQVADIAERIMAEAVADGDGWWRVPGDVMADLEEALG